MFKVRLFKERFKFSSSHFTLFSESAAEKLHGHNYQVQVEMTFKDISAETGLVAEFHTLKEIIDQALLPLDEKVLLPTLSPFLQIGEAEQNLEVKFADKFYSFPKEDCHLLDTPNISSECLALWIFEQLQTPLKKMKVHTAVVTIFETPGQGVSYEAKL